MTRPADRRVEILDRDSRSARLTMLARLAAAPFPFESDPATDPEPFFHHRDPESGERIRSIGGQQFGETAHYRDDRVLIHVPPSFDPAAPATVLIFLHGHHSTLSETVIGGHAVTRQINRSRTNTLLIAPQMAYDAADSHPGKLSRRSGAATLLRAAGATLASQLDIDPALTTQASIVVSAFSGGFKAAAHCLTVGGLKKRVAGVLLLDALYGCVGDFAEWKAGRGRDAYFVAIHGKGTAENTGALAAALRSAGYKIRSRLPARLDHGPVAIISSRAAHRKIPLLGPPRWPIAEVLRRGAL